MLKFLERFRKKSVSRDLLRGLISLRHSPEFLAAVAKGYWSLYAKDGYSYRAWIRMPLTRVPIVTPSGLMSVYRVDDPGKLTRYLVERFYYDLTCSEELLIQYLGLGPEDVRYHIARTRLELGV